MGRSSLEWLCFFIADTLRSLRLCCAPAFRTRRISPERATTGSQGSFCDCGHADRASPARLAPAASSATLICWRRSCARNSPWTLPTGSRPEATVPLPLIDVRVQWSTRHQDNAAQHAPMREFLLRTLSSLSDALVSAQWRPRVLHCRTNGSDTYRADCVRSRP